MRERGKIGGCPFCHTVLAAKDVTRDGLIHGRPQRAGGPFYTFACRDCGTSLVAERANSAGFRFYSARDLVRGTAMHRAVTEFIAAPARGRPRAAPASRASSASQSRAASDVGTKPPPPNDSPLARFADELEVLGLARDARLSDVKQRFRQLAKEYHPDRYQRASAAARQRAQEMFVRITTAYHAILDGLT